MNVIIEKARFLSPKSSSVCIKAVVSKSPKISHAFLAKMNICREKLPGLIFFLHQQFTRFSFSYIVSHRHFSDNILYDFGDPRMKLWNLVACNKSKNVYQSYSQIIYSYTYSYVYKNPSFFTPFYWKITYL